MAVDEEAIHGLVKRMETAWNAGDSEMYAAPFAEDVAFIHVFGGQLDGRSAVEASHRHIFQNYVQRQPRQFHRVEHALCSSRCRRSVLPRAHQVLRRNGSPRDGYSADVCHGQGAWKLAGRGFSKYSDFGDPGGGQVTGAAAIGMKRDGGPGWSLTLKIAGVSDHPSCAFGAASPPL